MDLYIMRHAAAEDGHGDDFSRRLTDKGRLQAQMMGDWLANIVAMPLLAVTSPYPRARETAAIVVSRLDPDSRVQVDERLGAGMAADAGSAVIHEFGAGPGRLLLLGHSPDLDRLVSHLVGAPETAVAMKKGAIAGLKAARAGFAGSTLRWLIDPNL